MTGPAASTARSPARPAVVVGEILCDLFTPERGVLLAEAPVLVPHVGGAPANVAIALGWHGHAVEMVSALGGDALSSRMRRILEDHGVGLDHVETKAGELVGLLLIAVDSDGERHFHPYREGTADLMMTPESLPQALIEGAALLHAGTVTLREEPVRGTTRRAIALAREAGVPVSIDVNLRPKLFSDPGLMLDLAREATRGADILKASRDEAVMMLGPGTIDRLVDDLHAMGPALVLLTDGDGRRSPPSIPPALATPSSVRRSRTCSSAAWAITPSPAARRSLGWRTSPPKRSRRSAASPRATARARSPRSARPAPSRRATAERGRPAPTQLTSANSAGSNPIAPATAGINSSRSQSR